MSWKTVALGDVCSIVGGGTPSKSNADYYTGVIPWATVRDMNNEYLSNTDYKITQEAVKESSTNIIPKNNVIIATRVGLGKVCILKQDTAINQDLRGVIPKDKDLVETKYLYYWFKSISKNLIDAGRGATVHGVTLPFVKSLKIPLPPIHIQEKIVTKLDAIFAEIDKATAAAEANIKNAEALFQSYLSEVFERGGEGFFKTTIGESCILRSGTTVNPDLEQKEGDLPYLKVADMNLLANQECIVTSSRFLNFKIVNKNSVIKKGSTIFPKRGGAIDTNKKNVDVDITVDLNIMSVFPNQPIEPYLLYFYFLSLDMKKLGSGSSIRQINNYDIEPLVFSYPTNSGMQKTLINKLKGCKNNKDNLISNYESKKIQLNTLKQSILQQAFNGELVKE